ncbi:unknown protein [Microcystis aeruginosa NIES-843]|uniref:Uncharacterized protein n=1 Tax=Microcystis aeruginosa (strain NIES-843 / IAM M-2473) TaxID=449447 RepID=B0JS86_MICAN|nr:unknown protein [Microcystis aeruginosa NIES-843]
MGSAGAAERGETIHNLGVNHTIKKGFIVISIKIENINARVHKGFIGLDCIRPI